MVDPTPLPTVKTVSGTSLLLSDLGHKVARGLELSNLERTMAISAANAVQGNQYGPSPQEMEIHQIPLPESVNGALADAMG
ncbi:MAG: hypothetical protein IJU40_00515 [Desulfovibrionaceae bacterium]|nr:hypothetical protein [Desulfovibrionaceae bacterium]